MSLTAHFICRMDQSASVIALPGSALYVSFAPSLHAEPIMLLRNAVLVCANRCVVSAQCHFWISSLTNIISSSLVVSNKAESARHQYNLRVVETLAAARVISNYLNLEVDSMDGEKTKRRLVTLREVIARKSSFYRDEQDAWQEDVTQLQEGLEDMLRGNVLDCLLPKVEGRTGVTLDEMISMSGMNKIEFTEVYLSWVDGEYFLFC